MSAFEERLIEDLGHEISDVVIAGEELLGAPINLDEPLQFAHEFRSLLRTLEVGIRLLQWNDLANLLTELGLKFDAAFVLDESAEIIREKMKKTVQLLLQVYESFDGVRFSPEQLSGWSAETHKIWEEPVATVDPAQSLNSELESMVKSMEAEARPAEITPSFAAKPADEASNEVGVVSIQPSTNTEALAVEFMGQEILIPVEQVTGLVSVAPFELQAWRAKIRADAPFSFRGQDYRWSELTDFRKRKLRDSISGEATRAEFVFIEGSRGKEVLEVDRILGFQNIEGNDYLKDKQVQSGFIKLRNRGHLASRWLRAQI